MTIKPCTVTVQMMESVTGECRRFTAKRTREGLLIMVAPGELRAGAVQSLAGIMQLGMDMRGADRNEPALPEATVEIVDSLPGGRPFLWLDRPDAVRLLVARGEMSEAGAQQLAEVLSSHWSAPSSGPPKPLR